MKPYIAADVVFGVGLFLILTGCSVNSAEFKEAERLCEGHGGVELLATNPPSDINTKCNDSNMYTFPQQATSKP